MTGDLRCPLPHSWFTQSPHWPLNLSCFLGRHLGVCAESLGSTTAFCVISLLRNGTAYVMLCYLSTCYLGHGMGTTCVSGPGSWRTKQQGGGEDCAEYSATSLQGQLHHHGGVGTDFLLMHSRPNIPRQLVHPCAKGWELMVHTGGFLNPFLESLPGHPCHC